jgi:hypothetical protein
VYVATFAVLILALVGLVLDTAFVRMTNQELQAAADAAALAGAHKLPADGASTLHPLSRQAAIDTALANVAAGGAVQLAANSANSPTGDIVVGSWNRYLGAFTPTSVEPDAVKVVARRTSGSVGGQVPLLFGGWFGTAEAAIERSAIAHLASGSEAVVLILDPNMARAFDLRGNAELSAPFNGIQVNSTNPCALYLNGQPDIPRLRAGSVNVVGNYCIPNGSVQPTPVPNSPPIPDPLAGVPEPTTAGMTNYGSITGPGTYSAGHYPGGINFNGGVAFLNPGIYYIGGPGIDLTGSALVQGNGVMLFLAETSRIRTSGSGPGLDIGGPTSGTYAGICIFYDRDNTTTCSISGGGVFDVRGTMYMKSGHLEMDGDVDRRIGRIIFNSQQLRGNGRYIITGEGVRPTGPRYPYLVH